MDEKLAKYRDTLLETLHFMNASYDKLLVALSGGALALSITFLKDLIDLKSANHPELLMFSWLAFILSLAAILGRIFFGIEAYRKAIEQVDEETIHQNKPGGIFATVARILYIWFASLLIV